jgi:hypothetical protein
MSYTSHLITTGDKGALVYAKGEKKSGKPADLTDEERFAIGMIDHAMEILQKNIEYFPNKRRMLSIDIWKDHINVMITQYTQETGGEHKNLAYVYNTPERDEYTVVRL